MITNDKVKKLLDVILNDVQKARESFHDEKETSEGDMLVNLINAIDCIKVIESLLIVDSHFDIHTGTKKNSKSHSGPEIK